MQEDETLPMIREICGELAELFGHHVPFIKLSGDVAKLGLSLPDRILRYKIDLFLKGVPPKTWQSFIERIRVEPDLRQKTGEHLLLTLNQMDDIEKAEVLAKIFCAYAEEKISRETFKRLASSINAAFFEDLKQVASCIPPIQDAYIGNLLRAGLSEVVPIELPNPWKNNNLGTLYRLNMLGRIFQQVMKDEPITG